MVSHANLMANQEMIRCALQHDDSSTFVSWLPVYHDMGLIGNILQTLYLGSSCVFMSPVAFLQKPDPLAPVDFTLSRAHEWRARLRLPTVRSEDRYRITRGAGDQGRPRPELVEGCLQRLRAGPGQDLGGVRRAL